MEDKTLCHRFLPSNGTEGMMFVEDFCSHCVHEKFMNTQNHADKKCEILDNSILNDRPCLNKDIKFDGWEWFDNRDFNNYKQKCNQHKHWDWGNDRDGWNEPPESAPDDPNQLVMFSFDEKIDGILNESELISKEE